MNTNKFLRLFGCVFLTALLFVGQFLFVDYIRQQEISEKLLSQNMVLTVGDEIPCDDLLGESMHKSKDITWEFDNDGMSFDDDRFICEISGEWIIIGKKDEKRIVECSVAVISRSVISMQSDFSVIGEGLTDKIAATVEGGYDSEIKYSSENNAVASVSSDGVITAGSAGKTRIKVSAYGCESVYFNVEVPESPSYIKLSAEELKMGIGESCSLNVILPEDSYNEIPPTFSSSDDTVAQVDENGVITAKAKGSCIVKATAYSGVSAECSITVSQAPSAVTLSVGDDFLYAGETVTVKAKVNDGASCGKYTFKSSNPAVADVSADGVVTGKGRGSATIEVSTYNGKKSSCKVSVQIFDYMTPPTSQDVYDAVGYMAEFYPELISTEKIGESVKGKDIVLLKLGKGNKKACIVAGIHSKEDISVAFTMRCIEEYAAAYCSSTGKYSSYNMKKMLDEYTLYIVPTMNPDGLDICNAGEEPLYKEKLTDYEREKYKSNANGVNLNRNFPFLWDNVKQDVTQSDITTYKGDAENSEPETQAIVKLVEENDFEWLFSMHCKGYFVYWADAYNKTTKADTKLAYRLQDICGFGLNGATPMKNLGGGLENWFRYKTGKPGFCVELVAPEYSTEVNKYFSMKTNWTQTRFTFIQGMR